MKKIVLSLILLITLSSFAQKQKATIYFRDGTSIEGLAKITPFNKIKFRVTKKSKQSIYDSKTVKSVVIQEKKYSNPTKSILFEVKKLTDIEYVYMAVIGRPNPILLNPLMKGEITIYKEIQINYDGSISPIIYLSKGKEILAHKIGYPNLKFFTFAKDITEILNYNTTKKKLLQKILPHMQDCSELIEKIKNKEFKEKSIFDIIQFYNQNCDE